jgi:hypothetical protein
MDTNTRIKAIFNRFKSTSLPENVFIPHKEKSSVESLKIAKTIEPENRASFNEVFENVRECLKG